MIFKMMDSKTRNAVLAEITAEARRISIASAELLSRIRQIEATFWAEDAIKDKKKKEKQDE